MKKEDIDEELVKKATITISDMYKNEKSYKYVLHLIHAYLPSATKTKIVDNFKDTNSKTVLCVITKLPLSDSSNIEDVYFADGITNVKQAFLGENTTSYLCLEAVKALHEFAISKANNGDKRISWLFEQI